jgi:hypothetical protein
VRVLLPAEGELHVHLSERIDKDGPVPEARPDLGQALLEASCGS